MVNDQGKGGSGKDPWPIRVAVHLEEAPAFHFIRANAPGIAAIPWQQRERSWVIRGDSQVGIGGAFTQKLWLALLSLYEAERRRSGEIGVVYYSKGLLAERMRVSRDGGNFRAIDTGLIQLDALRAYITGRPLPGPDADETRALPPRGGSSPRVQYLYSFLGGEGLDVEEEATGAQLYLFPPGGRRRRTWSRRRLGRYVVACLESQHARTVPDFVFDLQSGWAVRLVRLLGKRAYQDEKLEISLAALLPAVPALSEDGGPLRVAKARERLERAHDQLYAHGFIRDASIADGMVRYRFGAAHRRRSEPLPEGFAADTAEELMAAFGGEEHRRSWVNEVVREIGPDLSRAALSDARRLVGPDGPRFEARLHGLLTATLEQARADRRARQSRAGEASSS